MNMYRSILLVLVPLYVLCCFSVKAAERGSLSVDLHKVDCALRLTRQGEPHFPLPSGTRWVSYSHSNPISDVVETKILFTGFLAEGNRDWTDTIPELATEGVNRSSLSVGIGLDQFHELFLRIQYETVGLVEPDEPMLQQGQKSVDILVPVRVLEGNVSWQDFLEGKTFRVQATLLGTQFMEDPIHRFVTEYIEAIRESMVFEYQYRETAFPTVQFGEIHTIQRRTIVRPVFTFEGNNLHIDTGRYQFILRVNAARFFLEDLDR